MGAPQPGFPNCAYRLASACSGSKSGPEDVYPHALRGGSQLVVARRKGEAPRYRQTQIAGIVDSEIVVQRQVQQSFVHGNLEDADGQGPYFLPERKSLLALQALAGALAGDTLPSPFNSSCGQMLEPTQNPFDSEDGSELRPTQG